MWRKYFSLPHLSCQHTDCGVLSFHLLYSFLMIVRIYEAIKFFLIMVVIFYFYSSMGIFYSILKWNGGKAQMYWSKLSCHLLNAKFKKLEGSAEISKTRKTLILLNHRSWADFFIHDVILEFSANFMSRWSRDYQSPTHTPSHNTLTIYPLSPHLQIARRNRYPHRSHLKSLDGHALVLQQRHPAKGL